MKAKNSRQSFFGSNYCSIKQNKTVKKRSNTKKSKVKKRIIFMRFLGGYRRVNLFSGYTSLLKKDVSVHGFTIGITLSTVLTSRKEI